MPKLTKTGWEIGSSEAGAIVLHKTAFQTRHEVLHNHKMAKAGVETIDRAETAAMRRGNALEGGVADWASLEIRIQTGVENNVWEPTEPFKIKELGIASSIDRLIEVNEPMHLPTLDGDIVEMDGVGVLEIKTDFYHHNKPKEEWVIQVAHQMLCADLEWAIIACLSQTGKLHLYPVQRSVAMERVMKDAYKEFWHLVDTDGEYPPIDVSTNEVSAVDLVEVLPETHGDVALICNDYLRASSEAANWNKTKKELKEKLCDVLDRLEIEKGSLPNYEIKSVYTKKPKKKMVETDEVVESHTFSVKEISNE
jgi:hypothetical protein